jgi:two-component system, chemotaxis family, response regulator Rcp1
MKPSPVRVLLIEDDPGDVELIREALGDAKIPLDISHVPDGEEGMRYLRRQGRYTEAKRPDFILLDLNMPRMNGWEVLAAIKGDTGLKTIPVVILTTSDAEKDVLGSYHLGANCYLKKPLGFDDFLTVVRSVENFWLALAELPPRDA